METITQNSNAVLTVPLIGKHEKSGIFVRADGYVLKPKSGWSKGTINKTLGYYQYLYNHTMYYVHRLVAETFIDNPNNFPVVDHINRVRDDNRDFNLRFTTQQQNVLNSSRCENNPCKRKGKVDYSVLRQKRPEQYAKILARNQDYYHRNKEKRLAQRHAWYLENRDSILKRVRERRNSKK